MPRCLRRVARLRWITALEELAPDDAASAAMSSRPVVTVIYTPVDKARSSDRVARILRNGSGELARGRAAAAAGSGQHGRDEEQRRHRQHGGDEDRVPR